MSQRPLRRAWLRTAAALGAGSALTLIAAALLAPGSVRVAHAAGPLIADPASLVDTKIMSGGIANDFPGSQAPFGMLQWTPNMRNRSAGSNYDDSDTSLRGYALTALAGPGCDAMGDVPIMPLVGGAPGTVNDAMVSYDHASEVATPGYFSAKSSGGQVQTELTTTQRAGIARLTYPSSTQAAVLVKIKDAPSRLAADGAAAQIVGNNEISGWTTNGHFCGDKATYTLHFDIVFDRPFTSSKVIGSDGVYVSFDTTSSKVVQAKVGVSFVSDAGAKANHQAEIPNWDFAAVRTATHNAWNGFLSRIDVAGGTADQQKLFYTSLYHQLNHPNIVSDANGQYTGYDKKVHTVVAGQRAHYENFSGWDTYHSQAALAALLAPREVGEMATSMLQAFQQSGEMPQWAFMNSRNGVMIGDSAPAIIAEFAAFGGAHSANDAELLTDLVKQATTNNNVRWNSTQYDQLGYTPDDPSMTIEWTQQDFALSRLAYRWGDNANGDRFTKRSLNWKNIVDPQTKLLSPRASNGTFTHVTPSDTTHNYMEGSAAQYRFQVPSDQPALAKLIGGDTATNALLDDLFQSFSNESPTRAYLTNEFSQGQQWFYNWTHAPARTQEVVHRWLTKTYAANCCTFPNNDDLGTMSAQYAWAAMGVYPENLGTTDVTLSAPIFTQVTIHLPSGNTLTLSAPQASANNYYIQSMTVNGTASSKLWLPGSMFTDGGNAAFTLGSSASSWGSGPNDTPPAYDGVGPPPPVKQNLALNRPATGSTPCAASEGPAKAVNGSATGGNGDKWCSASGASPFLQVDLGSAVPITSFRVQHAQAGGENAAWNTRDFDIQVSTDGTTFTPVVQARGNTGGVSTHPVSTTARYIKLVIVHADQSTGTTARIYEFEAYGP